MDIWKSWSELNQICKSKEVILFGRSDDWVLKTLQKLHVLPKYILDNSRGYTGEEFYGMKIYLPEKIKSKKRDDIYIIITTGEYESVVKQLRNYGLTPGKHFCCSPILNDLKLRQEIHNYQQKLLISSCDYNKSEHRRYSKAGGGLFTYDIQKKELKKLYPGVFRQLERGEEVFYAVEHLEMAICILSKNLKLKDKLPLNKKNANACGLAYWPRKNQIFVADCSLDIIFIYDAKNFKLVGTIESFDKSNTGQHHINDLCIVDNSLYVSYFSKSGNYKRGILDGGISEFDLENPTKKPVEVVSNLWMPHSIEFLDNNLCFCESMKGAFHVSNQMVSGVFPGFVRGLDFDGRFYFIGQSEDIYMSRLFGISNNIMLNAGFYIFDLQTKVSRFHSFMDSTNVHDLLVLGT